MILITPDDYKVAVDQRHYISYAHRIPLSEVNTIHILGHVDIERIDLSQGPYQPPSHHTPPSYQVCPPGPIPTGALYDLTVPFENFIPNGMDVMRTIYISGRPNSHPDSFNIDLLHDDGRNTDGDRMFHISVRFRPPSVVRNSLTNGEWGPEETDLFRFPFESNVSFDMKITCEREHFTVFLNGQFFCNYRHRLAFTLANKIRVRGDVFIKSLMFN